MTSRASPRRILLGFVAAFLLPLLALADAGIARARGWVPLGDGRLLLPVLGAVLLAGGLTLLFPAARRWYARSARSLLVVSVSALFALLAAEMLLATRLPAPAAETLFHLRTPFEERTFRPDPEIMPGVSGPSRYRVSSLGVRGDEPTGSAGEYRVLCLGGSTTECLYLDDAETWPALVQRLARAETPGVWVGNAGFSGYTTAEHLEFLENSPLVPRMDCIVLLAGVNDLGRVLGGGTFDARFFHPRMRIKPRLVGSNLANLVTAARQRMAARGGRGRLEVEDEAGLSYRGRRRARGEGPVVALPDLTDALAGFEARLSGIVDTCARLDLRLVLVGQPVLWDSGLDPRERDLLWMGGTRSGYVAPGELREAMDRYNGILAAVAARRDLAWVDTEAMSGDSRFFYDDCHLNEAGAAEMACRVAPAVLDAIPR